MSAPICVRRAGRIPVCCWKPCPLVSVPADRLPCWPAQHIHVLIVHYSMSCTRLHAWWACRYAAIYAEGNIIALSPRRSRSVEWGIKKAGPHQFKVRLLCRASRRVGLDPSPTTSPTCLCSSQHANIPYQTVLQLDKACCATWAPERDALPSHQEYQNPPNGLWLRASKRRRQ